MGRLLSLGHGGSQRSNKLHHFFVSVLVQNTLCRVRDSRQRIAKFSSRRMAEKCLEDPTASTLRCVAGHDDRQMQRAGTVEREHRVCAAAKQSLDMLQRRGLLASRRNDVVQPDRRAIRRRCFGVCRGSRGAFPDHVDERRWRTVRLRRLHGLASWYRASSKKQLRHPRVQRGRCCHQRKLKNSFDPSVRVPLVGVSAGRQRARNKFDIAVFNSFSETSIGCCCDNLMRCSIIEAQVGRKVPDIFRCCGTAATSVRHFKERKRFVVTTARGRRREYPNGSYFCVPRRKIAEPRGNIGVRLQAVEIDHWFTVS